MSVEDALPGRPLFKDEIETLEDELPDEYQVQPGSAMNLGTDALLYPTFAVRAADGSVTLFGRNPREEVWEKIETWTPQAYDEDELVATVQEFGKTHFSADRLDAPFDFDEFV